MDRVRSILESFQCTPEELLDQLQLDEGDVVYVSGSLVEGFGNPNSDLDLFVLKESIQGIEAQFNYPDYKIQQIITARNQRFDVEYHPFSKVQEYLQTAQNFRNNELVDMEKLSVSKIDFLHRLRIALPLFGAETLHQLQKQIHVENVCASLKNWRIRSYNAHLVDCIGMLQIGDLDTAVHWARQALGEAIDVVLALHLDTNPSEKWRFRKLERAFGNSSHLYLSYRVFLTQEVPSTQREDYVQKLLSFAGDLLLEEQLKTNR